MNNKNKKSNLQFTNLTLDDIVTHEDLYIDILPRAPFMSKVGVAQLYYYNFEELQRAKQLFCKAFE